MKKRMISYISALLIAALLTGCAASGASASKPAESPEVSAPAASGPIAEPTEEPTPEPTPDPTPEPTEEPALALAKELLAGMSLKEKAGQMIMARCPGDTAPQIAAQYALGGYVMFGVDFENKSAQQVTDDITAIQASAKLPMLISVDEEGGTVNRVSSNPQLRDSRFMSPKKLFETGGWDSIAFDTREKCALLSSLGINVNLAPVCDLASEGSFMYDRSFSPDAEETSRYVKTVVEIMTENSMGSALKHFPGYGDNVDTHTGSALDERSYESFVNSDFLPFKAGIEAGAGSVMVNHNVVACMDDERPASLSPEVHRVLREELGFQGVILTDDLDMDAITEFAAASGLSPYVLAVQAGNDMLCCGDYETAATDVINAVTDGTLTEERLDESVLRILLWKIQLGLIEPGLD